jgi:hypothetical protein
VALQTTETAPLELLCVDQLTGAEFVCSRLAAAHRPCVFQFEHLLPNHAYDIILLNSVGGAGSHSGVLWGSFTTLRHAPAMLAHTMSGASHDSQVVHALRTATGGGGGPSPTNYGGVSIAGGSEAGGTEHGAAHGGNAASNAIRLLLLGANKPSWRSKFAPPPATGTGKASRATNVSAGSAGLDRVHLSRGVALCQEVAGCLAQGWSGVDIVLHCGYAVDYGLTIDAVLNLLTQAETMQSLHVGSTAQHSFAVSSNNLPLLPSATTTSVYNSSSGSQTLTRSAVYQPASTTDCDYGAAAQTLLLQAFEQLRTAYLTHWGATPHTSSLLAHGNHYFLASPLFDLLAVFHATSLRDLRRDLSPYAVHHLMAFVTQLQLEYQTLVSCPVHSIVVQNQHAGDITAHSAASPYLRLLDGGAVAVFELQPNFSYQADTMQRVGDQLLSEEQLKALQRLLFPHVGVEGSDQQYPLRTTANSSVHTLVLLSPIPLVLESEQVAEYSQLTGQQRGVRYQHREVVPLLDLLALWLELSPLQREVIIIAGGVPSSFITTIDVESAGRSHHHSSPHSPTNKRHTTAGATAASPHHRTASRTDSPLPNLQEGSLASHPSHPDVHDAQHEAAHSPAHHRPHHHHHGHHSVRIRQMCVGCLVGIREDIAYQTTGTLLSPHGRRFQFTHRACEIGTGEMTETTAGALGSHNNTRPQTAATSGTAAALDAARAADFYPQVGLVEIPTMEARLRHMQQLTQHSQHLRLSPSLSPQQLLAPSGSQELHMEPSHHSTESIQHRTANLRFLDESALKAAFRKGWPLTLVREAVAGPGTAAAAGGASIAGSLASALHPGGSQVRSIVRQGRLSAHTMLHHLAEEVMRLLPTETAPLLRPVPTTATAATTSTTTAAAQAGAAATKTTAAGSKPTTAGAATRATSAAAPTATASGAPTAFQEPVDPFVTEIRRALDVICRRERPVFEECHELFLRQDHFPLPVTGGINVERSILAMTACILSKMQPATRAVCKVPSSFVVRLVWEHYERQATKLVKPADSFGAVKSADVGETVLAEFVTASMSADVEYFVRLLRTCFEVQLVVEYHAYSRGLLDGAER